mmetsp:Transcript_105765/g.337843  ORF Transcript_105765/g.337843 Transcript_105765/m.337843 type:complete len:211 (-) Transcript_105765:2577-3209(-)
MLAFVEGRVVGANVAIGSKPPARQSQAVLEVVVFQGLSPHLDPRDKLPPARHCQYAVGDAARQRHGEHRLRAHRKGGKESFVTLRRAHALDDVEQLTTLSGFVQDGCAGEASQHQVLGREEQVPEPLQLITVLRLGPHQVVGLVHENDLVAVHVRGALVKADLHDGRYWLARLPDVAEDAARGGVPDCSQRCHRHAFARMLLVEGGPLLV